MCGRWHGEGVAGSMVSGAEARLRVDVAAVLGRVRDDRVHLVQLHPGDGVSDERRLVQGLVVSALRLEADVDHLLEGQLDARLAHGHHDDRVVEVLLLRDVHRARRRLLEARLRLVKG